MGHVMGMVPSLANCRPLASTSCATDETQLASQSSATVRGLSLARKTICIGDVSLSLTSHHPGEIYLNHGLKAFTAAAKSVDIRVEIDWRNNLTPRQRPTFDSEALWALFRDDEDFIFQFTSPLTGASPYKILRMDRNFHAGEMVLNREALKSYQPVCPLEYPADELLLTNYLAHHGQGVEVHGCGLIDFETGGYLFLGHSGAGKSTTARLWQLHCDPEILSDDRLILRIHDGSLWMYGTPWHGEAAFASPGKAKLNRLFILQHGTENKIAQLSKARAAGELFARSFPPFHSALGMERTVEFLKVVVESVPCYEFCFTPDRRAIEMALNFHE